MLRPSNETGHSGVLRVQPVPPPSPRGRSLVLQVQLADISPSESSRWSICQRLGSPQGFSLSAAISTSASKEDVDGGCPQRLLYKAEDEKAMGRGGMGMGSSLYFVAQATAWESNPTREDKPAETPAPPPL